MAKKGEDGQIVSFACFLCITSSSFFQNNDDVYVCDSPFDGRIIWISCCF